MRERIHAPDLAGATAWLNVDRPPTIRDLRGEFPGVKIIAVTGYEPLRNYDVFEVARQAGASKTFMKPFKFEDLVAAVRELTGG